MVRKRNGMTLSIIGLSSLYAMRDLYYNIEIPRRAAHIKLQERENTNIVHVERSETSLFIVFWDPSHPFRMTGTRNTIK